MRIFHGTILHRHKSAAIYSKTLPENNSLLHTCREPVLANISLLQPAADTCHATLCSCKLRGTVVAKQWCPAKRGSIGTSQRLFSSCAKRFKTAKRVLKPFVRHFNQTKSWVTATKFAVSAQTYKSCFPKHLIKILYSAQFPHKSK